MKRFVPQRIRIPPSGLQAPQRIGCAEKGIVNSLAKMRNKDLFQ